MKNLYRVDLEEGKVYIEVFCKDERLETVISLDDLEKAKEHEGKWYAWYSKSSKAHYVCGWKNVEGKVNTFYLHRILTNCPKGKVVDHINHDTLNNTRENIRVVTQGENIRNYKKFVGVSKCSFTGKFRARLVFKGQRFELGRYDTFEEAKTAVLAKRAELNY